MSLDGSNHVIFKKYKSISKFILRIYLIIFSNSGVALKCHIIVLEITQSLK